MNGGAGVTRSFGYMPINCVDAHFLALMQIIQLCMVFLIVSWAFITQYCALKYDNVV